MDHPQAVPHNRLTFDESEVEAVANAVRSGFWACGPQVARLERTLEEMAGVKYAVCVASGLSALRLALLGLGVRPSDSVLIPAYCCVALPNSVLACGARPIPVDVSPNDWNMDLDKCRSTAVESKPRAIIAVSTFGAPVWPEGAGDCKVPVIEDCSHAMGIEVNGLALGGRTHAAALSFYATKLIGAGEGGAVLSNSYELAQFVRKWRNYADQPPNGSRMNDKMTDIEATLALAQIARLPGSLAARREFATRYAELLTAGSRPEHPFRLPDALQHRVWYRYTVEMKHMAADEVVEGLAKHGIHAAQPVADWRAGDDATSCPTADRAYRKLVSLPLYPTLTHAEQNRVVDALLTVSGAHPEGSLS